MATIELDILEPMTKEEIETFSSSDATSERIDEITTVVNTLISEGQTRRRALEFANFLGHAHQRDQDDFYESFADDEAKQEPFAGLSIPKKEPDYTDLGHQVQMHDEAQVQEACTRLLQSDTDPRRVLAALMLAYDKKDAASTKIGQQVARVIERTIDLDLADLHKQLGQKDIAAAEVTIKNLSGRIAFFPATQEKLDRLINQSALLPAEKDGLRVG